MKQDTNSNSKRRIQIISLQQGILDSREKTQKYSNNNNILKKKTPLDYSKSKKIRDEDLVVQLKKGKAKTTY